MFSVETGDFPGYVSGYMAGYVSGYMPGYALEYYHVICLIGYLVMYLEICLLV